MNSSINNNVNLGGTQNVKGQKTFSSIKGSTAGVTSNSTVLATTAFVRSAMTTTGGLSTFSKSKNGYFKFLNGLKVQWGYTTGTTITFPTAFTSATSFGVSLTAVRTSAGGSWYGQVNSVTATNFKYLQDSSDSPAFWVAIGY